MTIREMQIDVRQATQLLGSNRRRKLTDDEIDWVLNKQQDRYVELNSTKLKITTGFEFDVAAMDKVKDLISTKERPYYITSSDVVGYSPLPSVYGHVLSDMSYVYNLCNTLRPSVTNVTYKLSRFKLLPTVKSAEPFYVTVNILSGTTTIASITDNAPTWPGLQDKDDLYLVRAFLINAFHTKEIEVYWERYDTQYFPNELIIIDPGTYSIIIDGNALTRTEAIVTRQSYPTTNGSWKNDRLYPSDNSAALRTSAFSSTYYESPISEVMDQRLIIYMDASYIVSKSRITYLRKPRRMSLILGLDSEITSGAACHEICDLAIEYIKKLIIDPSWEVTLRDNMQRTTI